MSSAAIKVWTGIDWTFVNQFNLSESAALMFYGPKGAPATTKGGLAIAQSTVWKNGSLRVSVRLTRVDFRDKLAEDDACNVEVPPSGDN